MVPVFDLTHAQLGVVLRNVLCDGYSGSLRSARALPLIGHVEHFSIL
jgi:hypothetical protein